MALDCDSGFDKHLLDVTAVLLILRHFVDHFLLVHQHFLFQSGLFKLKFVKHLLMFFQGFSTGLGWQDSLAVTVFLASWHLLWKHTVLLGLDESWLSNVSFNHLVILLVKKFAPTTSIALVDWIVALFWADAVGTAGNLWVVFMASDAIWSFHQRGCCWVANNSTASCLERASLRASAPYRLSILNVMGWI